MYVHHAATFLSGKRKTWLKVESSEFYKVKLDGIYVSGFARVSVQFGASWICTLVKESLQTDSCQATYLICADLLYILPQQFFFFKNRKSFVLDTESYHNNTGELLSIKGMYSILFYLTLFTLLYF